MHVCRRLHTAGWCVALTAGSPAALTSAAVKDPTTRADALQAFQQLQAGLLPLIEVVRRDTSEIDISAANSARSARTATLPLLPGPPCKQRWRIVTERAACAGVNMSASSTSVPSSTNAIIVAETRLCASWCKAQTTRSRRTVFGWSKTRSCAGVCCSLREAARQCRRVRRD